MFVATVSRLIEHILFLAEVKPERGAKHRTVQIAYIADTSALGLR
jgi:hypothetical protein